MSIKGLTDQSAAFPIIGQLRKGEKKPESGNRPGKDLTYLRFTTEDELARQMFTQAYPDQEALRNINVFFPFKTADENMDSWIEKWVSSSLVYRSDGETVVLWRTPKGGYSTEPRPDPKPEEGEDGKRSDGSSQVGRLSVIIPELGRFDTVTVLTTSKWDVINLTRQLRAYESLLGGDLRGTPFVIKRRPQSKSTPSKDGKRIRRDIWLLSVEPKAEWSIGRLGLMEQAALSAGNMVIDTPDILRALPDSISSPFEEPGPLSNDHQPVHPSQPKEEPKPTNGNGKAKLPRPMTPEQVKQATTAAKYASAKAASEEQLGYAASSLSKACGNDDKKRHTVTLYLFGQESLKSLNSGQLSFIIDWIGAKADNGYEPPEDAAKEIKAIVAEYLREQGQLDMFGGNELEEYFPREQNAVML